MAIAHIHIGTNQGDLANNLRTAIDKLRSKGNILDKSHIYETEAWGKVDQPNYYNMAVTYETKLDQYALLQLVNEIEDELGRVRKEKWGKRIIDLDVIKYDDKVIYDEKLTIQHKHIDRKSVV